MTILSRLFVHAIQKKIHAILLYYFLFFLIAVIYIESYKQKLL